ncbi:MAG TPA: SDR family NAD(P)-dependent oxidoreductase [Gemmatimonadaceae bacterium]|nr:SDR family NAD(P)-dependent oxidoreductase [Gemmatimonadaceae bacterium]
MPNLNAHSKVLVTGSTDGVGRCVAERLGAEGATVLVHGRNRARAESVAHRTKIYIADLASLAAVRELATDVTRDYGRLDLLINNAGIGTGKSSSKREVSEDGYELRFAVNYLAGFLLTHLLQPARVVNVASIGQQAIDFDDVMLEHGYSGVRAYCQSKLAQIMFTFDLAAAGIPAVALHPATYMDTTMVREAGVSPVSTVDEGADAIIHAAESSDSGVYYNGLQPARANAQAYNAAARDRLRELSYSLTGITAGQASS